MRHASPQSTARAAWRNAAAAAAGATAAKGRGQACVGGGRRGGWMREARQNDESDQAMDRGKGDQPRPHRLPSRFLPRRRSAPGRRHENATPQAGRAGVTAPPATTRGLVCSPTTSQHILRSTHASNLNAHSLRSLLARQCCRRYCCHGGAGPPSLPAGWQPPQAGPQTPGQLRSRRQVRACPHPAHRPRPGAPRTQRATDPRCRTPPPAHCRQSPPCHCCAQVGSRTSIGDARRRAASLGDKALAV